MGIEACDVEFLLEARGLGFDFGHTLTVVRQELKVDDRQLSKLFGSPAMTGSRQNGFVIERLVARELFIERAWTRRAQRFYVTLGEPDDNGPRPSEPALHRATREGRVMTEREAVGTRAALQGTAPSEKAA